MNCTETLLECGQALLDVGNGVIGLESYINANGLMIMLFGIIIIGLLIMILKNNDEIIKLKKMVKP